MAFKPIIGNLVQVDVSASDISSSGATSGQLLAANGSGGAGWVNPADQYIDGEVATYADLPVTVGTPPVNSAYLVRQGSGVYLINRKPAGIYVRNTNNGNLADWSYAGAFPDVFTDSNFTVYNSSDSSKNLKFDASGITTNTTRTLTVPDKSGTLALTDDVATKEPLQTAATQAEAEAGTVTSTRSFTPQRISQAITALAVNFLRGAANTWSGIQTFTSSFVANGTNNTMPNQTAASGSSVMTRDLVDVRAGVSLAGGFTSPQTGTLLASSGNRRSARFSKTLASNNTEYLTGILPQGSQEFRGLLYIHANGSTNTSSPSGLFNFRFNSNVTNISTNGVLATSSTYWISFGSAIVVASGDTITGNVTGATAKVHPNTVGSRPNVWLYQVTGLFSTSDTNLLLNGVSTGIALTGSAIGNTPASSTALLVFTSYNPTLARAEMALLNRNGDNSECFLWFEG